MLLKKALYYSFDISLHDGRIGFDQLSSSISYRYVDKPDQVLNKNVVCFEI